ncbi:MAG: Holliday junction branch migration DNA helicase RuvB [Anaerolineaceae bacterium 4572_78]|nr:MAG: Holliday junction branch migration DNA helicase RuvB [Anaerolineaceae bacterium 4572_78]
MNNRSVSPHAQPQDKSIYQNLRPTQWDDYFGQDLVKKNIKILIAAAKQREEPLDHVLLYGPPGLGKTTLATIIAYEMKVNLKITSGPAIERPGDLAAILTNLRKGDVLFIDEIHRMSRAVEEILYPAMEDFALDIIIGKGSSARNIRLKLPRFTILGATTRLALLSSPLRDRFGSIFRLDFYSQADLEKIVTRSAVVLNVPVKVDGAQEIAARSRGTARIANRLLKRARDFAQVEADGIITGEVANDALMLMEVDKKGLDNLDRKVLHSIIDKFDGGPVGLDTIAASISEEGDTIMDVVEPYLLQLGFIMRTPRGRKATSKAYQHLGFDDPEQPTQSSLL